MKYLLFILIAGLFNVGVRAQPAAAPAHGVYELEGFTVEAPADAEWFELRHDAQHAFFGKKIASRTHSFVATATSSTLTERFATPEEFVDYIRKATTIRGDARYKPLVNAVEATDLGNKFCAKYYLKAEDHDAFGANGRVLTMETFGVSCLHPDNPTLSVDISFTERSLPAEVSAQLRNEGENFVRSVKFTAPAQHN